MDTVNPERPSRKWLHRFLAIWTGQAFSLLGSQLVQFALIWWLTKTTGSATVLATASLVGLLPQVFLGPFAGALVDRGNRRVVMILADGLIAAASVVLVLLFATGAVQVWHVYLLMFLRSAAGAFHWPAMTASTSLMIPEEHLARIQGFNQMLNGGLNIVAAPLGALLLEILPMQGVLAVDIGTAILAILPLLWVPVPQPDPGPARPDGQAKPSVLQDFSAGLRYLRAWQGALWLLAMALLINLVLSPAFSLLPLLVTQHFNGQALQYAALESIGGIGIIAGGMVLGVWGGFRRRILTSVMGLILIGAGVLTIGLVPASAFSLAILGMFVMGFATPLTNGPVFAIIQSTVAPAMQGRVLSLIGSLSAAMAPVGLIVAGPVAGALGVRFWFVVGGILTGMMGIWAFFVPSVMNIEAGHGIRDPFPESQPILSSGQGD